MAKKSKGNRVQVILECTEHKSSLECREHHVTLRQKTVKIRPTVMELKKFNPVS